MVARTSLLNFSPTNREPFNPPPSLSPTPLMLHLPPRKEKSHPSNHIFPPSLHQKEPIDSLHQQSITLQLQLLHIDLQTPSSYVTHSFSQIESNFHSPHFTFPLNILWLIFIFSHPSHPNPSRKSKHSLQNLHTSYQIQIHPHLVHFSPPTSPHIEAYPSHILTQVIPSPPPSLGIRYSQPPPEYNPIQATIVIPLPPPSPELMPPPPSPEFIPPPPSPKVIPSPTAEVSPPHPHMEIYPSPQTPISSSTIHFDTPSPPSATSAPSIHSFSISGSYEETLPSFNTIVKEAVQEATESLAATFRESLLQLSNTIHKSTLINEFKLKSISTSL